MNKDTFKDASPLSDFWNSDQEAVDDKKRLKKLAKSGISVDLFKYEPYKWEILFQSILLELGKGKSNAIRGLLILLDALDNNERQRVIEKIKGKRILPLCTINKLVDGDYSKVEQQNNFYRYIRILIDIFTNPYGIDIKQRRKRIYEHTGYLFNKIR